MRLILSTLLLLSARDFTSALKCPAEISSRLDCAPDRPDEKNVCNERHCCYSEETNDSGAPKCFFPSDYVGYQVKDVKRETNKLVASLERHQASGLPKDVQHAQVVVTMLSDSTLRIKVTDADHKRFEAPLPKLNLDDNASVKDELYAVDIKDGLLTVTRKASQKEIFATDLTKLIFADQFMQLKSRLSSDLIYGLGEHKAPFKKSADWRIYTMSNHDTFPYKENAPLYGSHAFLLNVDQKDKGRSSGVFLMNSHAIDVLLQPEPAATWRPIGGILDLFVFVGPSAKEVVQQYVSLIGRPALPPFWSLGYHQCRCCPAPHTLSEQKVITERTIAAGIPFDVQWNAKEYMVSFNDFTIDNKTFGGFGEWVKSLHKRGMHYVPIVDPGIDPTQPKGTYPPFDDGQEMDLFIKNASGKLLVGRVWNKSGKTVFPDFSHPNATRYWTKLMRDFHKQVAIDGSWNDMNEISNAVDGSYEGCPKNELENPPYLPGGRLPYWGTLCMSARQAAGQYYNVHNLYALFWAIVTNKALRDVREKRPFIISRASSPGLGVYAGHWNGDTFSSYDQMAWTVPSILNFNMFGIPLVGGDICGFQGLVKNDSSFQQLCARWLELGAFYPFARNHNTKEVDQDPVALGPAVVSAAKNALLVRYSLLPYLYTLFYSAQEDAQTVARPLFMEFAEDSNAYSSVSESQFLWGSAFMVIPVLKANQTSVHAYFPAGLWYPYTLELDQKPLDSTGQFVELSAPVGKINTALRGGHVVPVLPPKQTTTEMRKEKFGLIVALDKQQTATGSLYWDDGDSLDTVARKQFSLAVFDVKNTTLHVTPKQNAFKGATLGSVDVLGVKSKPSKVTVNGASVPFEYGTTAQKVSVRGLSLSLFDKESTITWH